MSLHIARWHDGIYTALSIDLHLGYILDPMPLLEGVRIQEGSLCTLLYTMGTPSGGILDMVTFV